MLNRLILARTLAYALAFLAVFALPAQAARDGSTDRPGLDYRTFELSAPNPDLCENACKREQQCRSWSYSWPGSRGPKAMCALKTGVPPKRSDTCCISGVMSTSSPVTRTDDPQPQPQPQQPAQAPREPSSSAKTDVETTPLPSPVPAPKTTERPATKPAAKPEDSSTRVTVVPKPKPAVPQQQDETARVEPEPAPLPSPQDDDQAQGSDLSEQTLAPEKVAACRDYANRAIEQNAENQNMRCGLTGSRWGFGYDAYYNYCARSPASAYESARRARDEELARCKTRLASRNSDGGDDADLPQINLDLDGLFNGSGRDERFCRNFAAQSVRQVEEARRLDCGFGGTRWSPSRVRQARLCEDMGPRAAAQLLNVRSAQLERCRAESGGRGFAGSDRGDCAAYAQESVLQARTARRLGCGFRGPRWTTSYRAHLRWCQRAPYGEVVAELRTRERFLDRCE